MAYFSNPEVQLLITNPKNRGCQISLLVKKDTRLLFNKLNGVICEPNTGMIVVWRRNQFSISLNITNLAP
jgi:hypothetical protein